MESYAVIETGGKQYRVEKGNVLKVERLEGEPGKNIKLPKVLAVFDGKSLTIGTPEVSGAKVTAKVVEHLRGTKLFSFKMKRRKGYRRKIGHRQELTKIEIVELGEAEKAPPKKAEAEATEAEVTEVEVMEAEVTEIEATEAEVTKVEATEGERDGS